MRGNDVIVHICSNCSFYPMKSLFVAAVVVTAVSGASAETTLSGVKGSVMVNSGTGFLPVSGQSSLKAGDRVLISSKSSAQLR